MLQITVLAVPECPNAPLALERVTAAAAGRAARVELIEVDDEDQAAQCQMTGSPTILVDGVDPFARVGAAPSVSCRLYPEADGTVTGAPSVAALREALNNARRHQPASPEDCCGPEALDTIDRAGRGRRTPAERGLRGVHQAVLRHFAATGTAPEPDTLEPAAAQAGRTTREVLAELAAEDLLTLDDAGAIRAAYPFSAAPTRHRVQIDGGVQVWSMCAIDALGIPAMLEADAVISSTDPVNGAPVTVAVQGGATTWEPPDAVVFVGQRPGGGPAATACCDALNFFTSATSARAWARDHPEVPGRHVDQAQAEALARQTFGPLLER